MNHKIFSLLKTLIVFIVYIFKVFYDVRFLIIFFEQNPISMHCTIIIFQLKKTLILRNYSLNLIEMFFYE